jgi:two-component system, LytTR family, sensor histidine kinase AlgZ
MHPLLGRSGRIALYFSLWALIGALLAALLAAQGGLGWMGALLVALPLAAAYSFVCTSAWYVARTTPVATSGATRLIATALGAAVISSTAWMLVARGWSFTLREFFGVRADFNQISPIVFGFGVLIYLLSLAVSYMVTASERAQAAERRALEVQVLSREAELRSLRAQIDPHFLFNSLHSISALTTANPAGARRMSLLLGDFLRQSLKFGAEERIPLERELMLAQKYLEIEQVRYGDRLKVEVENDGAGDCLVPSLLLQPIVENAVTHGVAHMLEGGTVRVSASRTPSRVSVVVESPYDPDRPPRNGTGVGLANVRSRLRATYGADAALETIDENNRWRVQLTFPATES